MDGSKLTVTLGWAYEHVALVTAVVCITCALYYLGSSIIVAHGDLARFPGPWYAKYSRLWMLQALWSEACNVWYQDVNEKYGMYAPIISHRYVIELFNSFYSSSSSSISLTPPLETGPLARIGPNNLITSDPDIFRHMLSVRSQYERGKWFDFLRLNPHKANLITERNRIVHNKLRARMAAGVSLIPEDPVHIIDWLTFIQYEGKDVEDFETIIDENLAN